MKNSNNATEQSNIEFKFNHNKLVGEYHLIDIIAIIQDLNINRGE